jgi:PAS domain S-box-containing protein
MMRKLLVLDDEVLILRSLKHLFEEDYEVFTTNDAETALESARQHDIAIILCDERMPGMSGHEFLRNVKDFSKATRIMMSGHANMSALTDAVNCGRIFAFVAKPWEPLQLRALVSAAAVHFDSVQEVDRERGLLRALMENIPDLIYFKDCQSRFTRVNEAHARNLGAQNSEECIGKSNADYFESEDAESWRLLEEEIVRSGIPLVDRIERPRGGGEWWSTTNVPMFDRRGTISGIAGISRNITALKRTEEKLRDENERNHMILETANDAFIAMDADGSITAWNPQAELTFGWTAAEAMGRHYSNSVVGRVSSGEHALGIEHFLGSGQGSRSNRVIELVALHRDGHEFPAEATFWPIRVEGVCTYNAFVRDISERRQSEEARKKEAKLTQLLQSVTVAANRSSTIGQAAKFCLDRICSYTGWPVGHLYLRSNSASEELVSTPFWHIEENCRIDAFLEASEVCRLTPETGFPGSVLTSGMPEWIVDLADRDRFFTRADAATQAGLRSGFAFPVFVEEELIGVLEYFSFLTVQPDEGLLATMAHIGIQLGQVIVRQRAEEELQRTKASAESANRAKSEFLTTVSHEIRTPLNAILGMAELLSETALVEEQRSYVHICQRAGENLLDLVNDILDFAKVESGPFELELVEFSLSELSQEIIEMMSSRASDRRLQLMLEILPDVPLRLIGDPNRLRQILTNLIGNALKFTVRGSVTVRVEVDPGGTAGWLRFNIIDTGIGIAENKIEMIFDRFTQADSATTRKYGGTGLGLAISKGLAEMMGGRIGCISEEGKGSTFFLSAPFGIRNAVAIETSTESASTAIPAIAPTEGQSATRVLIVEDSEFNVVLIKGYLKGPDFEVDVAENGKIGVERVIAIRPHLVIMDLQMPEMDGFEATRRIRDWEAMNNVHPTPILALTAHAAEEAIGRSLEAGCSEHLTKPVKKATLLQAISRHLRGKLRIIPPKDVESLVPMYLESVRCEMEDILAAVDSKDCEIASQAGHRLKGTGEGFGFLEISRSGAALELAASAANETEIRTQILVLGAYLDRLEIVDSLDLTSNQSPRQTCTRKM